MRFSISAFALMSLAGFLFVGCSSSPRSGSTARGLPGPPPQPVAVQPTVAPQESTNAPGPAFTPSAARYQFSDPGTYIKDFTIIPYKNEFHIFYIRGRAAKTQTWEDPGNEIDFGHAVSRDLRNWDIEAPVLPVRAGTWEDRNVWAPYGFMKNGIGYMFYTGVNQSVAQQIGMATSEGMLIWGRYEKNPILTPPAWTGFDIHSWSDGRDPCVLDDDGTYYLYYCTSKVVDGIKKGAVGVAESTDLRNWEDRGAALVTKTAPESPMVFRKPGSPWYYMILAAREQGVYRSKDPVTGWEKFDMRLPARTTAHEVFRVGDAWFIAGFEWKLMGNSVWIYPLRWEGDVPVVVQPDK